MSGWSAQQNLEYGNVSQPIASKLPLSNINSSQKPMENTTSIHNSLVNNINKSTSLNMPQHKALNKTNTNESLLQPTTAVRTEPNLNTSVPLNVSEVNTTNNDSSDEKLSNNQTSSTSSISPNDNSSMNNGKSSDGSITPTNNNGYFAGYLLKWANYIKGYQKRWFVLNNGLLSYFRYFFFSSQNYFIPLIG